MKPLFTKVELAEAVANKFELAKNKSTQIIDEIFTNIEKAVVEEEKDFRLPVMGGTLTKIIVEAHEARNPATGGVTQVPKKYKVKYKFKAVEVKE